MQVQGVTIPYRPKGSIGTFLYSDAFSIQQERAEVNIFGSRYKKYPRDVSPLITHLHSQDFTPMPDPRTGQCGKWHSM